MNLVQYKLNNGRRGLDSFWDDFGFSDFFDRKSELQPSVDIIENDDSFLLKMELPDIKKEDFKIEVKDKVLTISGEKKFEKEANEGTKYHRRERFYGNFSRSFSLPENLETDKIEAQYKDGVLNIELKKNKSYQKVVEVKVG